MYRSVGKLLRSLTMVLRCGASSRAMFSAALSTLNRLMEVLSVATTSFGPAPTRRAILSPARWGSVEPAGAVPAADQALAPFLRHHFGHAGGRGSGQDAQRVAVEVDHAGGQVELMAQVAQGVLRVELAAVFEGFGVMAWVMGGFFSVARHGAVRQVRAARRARGWRRRSSASRAGRSVRSRPRAHRRAPGFPARAGRRRRITWWLSSVLLSAGSMLAVSMPTSSTPSAARRSTVSGAKAARSGSQRSTRHARVGPDQHARRQLCRWRGPGATTRPAARSRWRGSPGRGRGRASSPVRPRWRLAGRSGAARRRARRRGATASAC